MVKKGKARCPDCGFRMMVAPGPVTCGRCRAPLFVPEQKRASGEVARSRANASTRATAREVSMPVQQKLVLTGRQDFDKLVASGYLPPPTPEMAADLQRRGVVVRKRYPLRVGDLIGMVAHVLGIPVCAACSKRRTWLNTHLPRVSVLVWLVLLVGAGAGVFKVVV